MPKIRKKTSVLEDDGLNMTPLIDCVFLLLIFFMVTTVFKNPQQLKLALPEAQNPQKLEQRQIVCELDDQDNIALNGQKIMMDSFETYLINEKQKSGNNILLIKADIAAKHGMVLQLMKIAKQAQIETIALAVEDANAGEE